jgi:hypothetical protein
MNEKKKVFDTNNTLYKLIKFLSKTNTNGYEICNIVDDDGDSIHAADIEELAQDGGQVFISTNAIKKLVSLIIDQQHQRVGASLNNSMEDEQ